MRSLVFILPALAIAPGAIAQKKPEVQKITPLGKDGWVASKLTLSTLAEKVKGAIAGLRNTKAELYINIISPEGNAIFTAPSVVLQIRDPKYYRIDYAVIQNLPFTATLTYNGQNRRVRFDTKVQNIAGNPPLAAAKVTGDRLVSLFEMDFPRLVFQGYTEGADAWKPLLSGWGKGVNGYKAKVEERRITYKGVKYLNYRIRAERTGAAVKKYGPSEFEIVLDGTRFLPVTIRNVRKDPDGKVWSTVWAAKYLFKQQITARDIALG